jgi:hypothetical protein
MLWPGVIQVGSAGHRSPAGGVVTPVSGHGTAKFSVGHVCNRPDSSGWSQLLCEAVARVSISNALGEPRATCFAMFTCAMYLPAASRVCLHASDLANSTQPHTQPPPN